MRRAIARRRGIARDMKPEARPWAAFAAVTMIGFLVWLGLQMTRTEKADRWLLALVVAGVLAGAAIVVGLGRRR